MTIFCLMIPSFCWKYVSKKSFITISSSDTESRLEKRRYKFFHISSDRRNIISIFSIYTCLPEKALFLNSIFTLRVHLAPKHRIYFFPIWWCSFDPAFVWRKKGMDFLLHLGISRNRIFVYLGVESFLVLLLLLLSLTKP